VAQTQLHADDLDVDLRGYQQFGAKYLLLQKHTVLGDEMGLGKTIQALAVMAHLSFKYQATHFLVVAPASIMGNWNREVVERTEFTIHMLHGPNRDQAERIWIKKGGVAITSYGTLDRLTQIRAQDVDFAVVDEAHYIKNPKAIRSKAVRSLTSRWKRFVLMTGTPLENKVGEFLNLITLCDEELGKRLDGYREHASDHSNEIADFESQVSQVYLRRNQEDVLKELPPCLEVDEWVTHSEEEAKGYRAAVRNRVHMMTLRRLANGEKGASAKFERVKELLQGYHEDGQKVVIFSFFKTTLDIVSGFADRVFRIDGDIAPNQRLSIIDEFSQSTDCAPLLSQIEAGGVGLNIQAASVVILIEPQWKPTTEWQAIKRVHRMGQSRRVIVHRMLTRNTVDQSLKDTLSRKSQVFDDYARESSVKDGSPAAVDTGTAGLKRQVMQMELDRLETTVN
jgi:SNF2 family DNA or RNA helicase